MHERNATMRIFHEKDDILKKKFAGGRKGDKQKNEEV